MGEAKRRKTIDPSYGKIPKGVVAPDQITVLSDSEKFLYLTVPAWADTWVNGGEIPINLASYYRSDARAGIYTPDENTIHQSRVDLRSLRPAIRVENVRNFNMIDCSINGKSIPRIIGADFYEDDGLILSFCTKFDSMIARRMNKKACVKILNIPALKACIDEQLGVEGVMGECRYVRDHQRNHFLKSVEDEWQNEYRMFWKAGASAMVKIPKGTAALMAIFG
jgi:hypothetical protein